MPCKGTFLTSCKSNSEIPRSYFPLLLQNGLKPFHNIIQDVLVLATKMTQEFKFRRRNKLSKAETTKSKQFEKTCVCRQTEREEHTQTYSSTRSVAWFVPTPLATFFQTTTIVVPVHWSVTFFQTAAINMQRY